MMKCDHEWKTYTTKVERKRFKLFKILKEVDYEYCHKCRCLLVEVNTLTSEEVSREAYYLTQSGYTAIGSFDT